MCFKTNCLKLKKKLILRENLSFFFVLLFCVSELFVLIYVFFSLFLSGFIFVLIQTYLPEVQFKFLLTCDFFLFYVSVTQLHKKKVSILWIPKPKGEKAKRDKNFFLFLFIWFFPRFYRNVLISIKMLKLSAFEVKLHLVVT